MDNYDKEWDSYFIPGTNVLNNKLGIINADELKKAEFDITFEKLVELQNNPISGNFDKEHLCTIHRFLFEEIYPFAGLYRTVGMRKVTFFTPPEDIDRMLDIVLDEMKNEFQTCHSYNDYVRFLAEYFADIMKVHPFREGNGRVIREFIREYVEKNMLEYELLWSKADKERLDYGIKQAYMTKTFLEMEFSKMLVLREDNLSFKDTKLK